MGRLSGFSYLDVTKKLRKLGFDFYRQGKGDHEVWFSQVKRIKLTIPRHRQLDEGTLRAILKKAQIDVDVFLDA